MPLVEYHNVELHRQEYVVLRGVDLVIEPSEMIFLTGRVGSGKSSLLKSLYAEVPIFSGSAMSMGYDLVTIKRKHIPFLRRQIGIVFQDFQLLTDRNVYANLRFVLDATGWRDDDECNKRIDEVLRQVGMTNKSYKMPHELSGGEQQRIVIARALLNSPKLILADEPTGNLDPETSDQIVGHLRQIAEQGTAVVIATHNHALSRRFGGRNIVCESKSLRAQNEV